MSKAPLETRKLILSAADELFYAEGFYPVSVDAIAEKAGVTKRTLYYHFRSKDDLIAAYLQERDRPTLYRYQKWAGESGSIAERMDRVFDKLAQAARSRTWRGCGFIRAVGELANMPGHPAVQIAREHKLRFEAWLLERLEAEGRPDAKRLSQALMILIDGTITQMLLHRSPVYADAARLAARAILTQSTPQKPKDVTPVA
jgi:AcrR family transcriptional regulator